MELDDLKNAWEEINNPIKINPKMIDDITQSKYNSNLKKLIYPEIIGMLICLFGVVYIGLHFDNLNSDLLKGVGVLAILLLVIIPIISLVSLLQFNRLGDVNKPYVTTLKDFILQKLRFQKLQKINITLCYLLLVAIIVLFSKIFGEKDITSSKPFWIFSFSFGYLFLLFYSKWVSRHYLKTLQETEDLLKEF